MTIKTFVEKAVEGGCKIPSTYSKGDLKIENVEAELAMLPTFLPAIVLLDPLAWKAVGKIEGWEQYGQTWRVSAFNRDMDVWEYKWHVMLCALAEGRTIEQYLETL